jgi:hypothetical protein
VNPLDALTLLLVVAAAFLGWRSGAIPQVSGLIGAIAGGAAVILAFPYVADPLSGVDPAFRPIIVLIGLIGAVAIGESIGAGLGRLAAGKLGDGLLGVVDRAMGSGLGVIQALLIVWLAGSLLAEGPVPRLLHGTLNNVTRAYAGVLHVVADLLQDLARVILGGGIGLLGESGGRQRHSQGNQGKFKPTHE